MNINLFITFLYVFHIAQTSLLNVYNLQNYDPPILL